MKKIICKLCNSEIKNSLGLSSHLHNKHNISVKDYCDKFEKKETEGRCVVCGKTTKFISFDKGYARVCGYQCSYKDPQRINKIKQLRANEDVEARIKKQKETNFKKFGVESILQLPNIRELTKKSNWTESARQKRKATNIDKYGYENPAQSEKVQEKMKQTTLDKFGAENVFASEYGKQKIKETNLEKYGYENPFYDEDMQKAIQSKIIDKYGGMGAASNIIKEKMEQTSLKKYNVKNTFNLPYVQSSECWQKRSETMRKNGNHSSYEDYFEQKLIELGHIKNKTYKIQYIDDRYPFHCDFYLVNEDAYIEINGTWEHGGHWYNPSNKLDEKTLDIWKDKAKDGNRYERAIKGWTEVDLIKRETAKLNNLNYIVLWTIDDINKWFNDNMPIRKDWASPIKISNNYKIIFDNNTYMIVDNKFIINIVNKNKSYKMNITSYKLFLSNSDIFVNNLKVKNIKEYENNENRLLEVIYVEE